MTESRLNRITAAALLALSGVASAQTGGVGFTFFSASTASKPDLISRQTAYTPGTAAYGSIKGWSGTSATAGFSVSSATANDLFGFSASSAGDTDGDGLDDIVVSAPLSPTGGSAAGRLEVYSAETGSLLRTIHGSTGQMLGLAAAGIVDVDADGDSDIAASGFLEANGTMRPAVFIYSGGKGDLLRVYDSEPGDGFGYLVRGLGDLNGDGEVEMAVVAPNRVDATTGLTVAEVDIITPAAAGDNRLRLRVTSAERCIIDVNVVTASGVKYIDVVSKAAERAYSHTLFSLSGIKVQSTLDTDAIRFKDVNKDNVVDMEDVWLVLSNLNTDAEPGNPFNLDLNKDGKVDENDLLDVVSAATGAPILKELSPFAQNRLTEMGEQFPLYFAVTPQVDMTAVEVAVDNVRAACVQCASGQRMDPCTNICCGPGEWITVSSFPPVATSTTTVGGSFELFAPASKSNSCTCTSAHLGMGSLMITDTVPRQKNVLANILSQSSGTGSAQWSALDFTSWAGSGPACSRDVNSTVVGTGGNTAGGRADPLAGCAGSASASGGGVGQTFSLTADFTVVPILAAVTCTTSASSSGGTGTFNVSFTPSGPVSNSSSGLTGSISVSGNLASSSSATNAGTITVSGSYTTNKTWPPAGVSACTKASFFTVNSAHLVVAGDANGTAGGMTGPHYFGGFTTTCSGSLIVAP